VLLRSIRAHLLPSLATLALAFVVSAGAVGVVGAARVGQTPGAVAAMLALYGAVALAEQSARTVIDRSHDVALARLRGLTGARLVTFAAGPLLAVSLVGIAFGSVGGVWLAGRIADGWGIDYSLGTREVVVAVTILVGAWVTIALVATAVIQRPLVEALSVNPRRHATSWITTFLELLVVAAACLAVYEAHRSEASWVPTIAPALVALAAGQVVMWLLTLTPRLGSRLGLALTSRRLRRDPDPGSVVRVLVAATVLLAVTLTGARAAAQWRDDAGRLRAGGPLAVPFDAGALRAYAAAHDADPQGRWLMAAVAVDDLSPADRRVFVDSHRWDTVVGDFVTSTSVAGAGDHMATLADQPGPLMVHSDSLQVGVTSIRAGTTGTVAVTFLSDEGFPRTARVHVTHPGSATARLGPCTVGCSVISVELKGAAFDLDEVSAGGTRILGSTSYAGGHTQHALDVSQESGPQAALTTPDLKDSATVDGIDGTSHEVHVLGSVGAVPFVGRAGSLLDLGRVLRGAVGTVASAQAVVVARADTPAPVLARLRKDGGGELATYAAVADRLDHTPQARADSLALLVAIGVALVALTHLLAWLAGQVGRRRAEVAGLRAAGVRPRLVRSAYVVEASILAVVVLVAAAVTAVATTVPLLRPMSLVGGWAEAPILRLEVRPLTLATVLVGVTAMTALLCALVFTRFGRGARPAALRSVER
jgi:putative ABC transport system permease protein